MSNSSQLSLRELIIGFGFLEGIWLAVGVNPEGEIINALTSVLVDLNISFIYILILKIIPVLAFIGTLFFIYALGRVLGLLAVASSFIGGLFIVSKPIIGIIFLFIGLGLGSITEH